MPLPTGTRIGPYEIVAPLGAGGMGEVYRARDTRLHRDVALKILPDAMALDPDRLSRFQREATLLASLNHPHIGAIYGLEGEPPRLALVLELIDGATLADRIARGALPAEEALAIARQIAGALDAAHEQGIVHRDLKPSNIKVRPDGRIALLDFGLAKAFGPATAPGDVSQSPTMTSPAMTRAGIILGTAAYMSPEQARGDVVDKRSDVWAFGCTFYEMLTGRRAFEGAGVSDTIAAVLRADPDWAALPAATPAGVVRLLRRCLVKDPKRRLRDLGDLDLALEVTPGPVRGRSPRHVWTAATAAAVLLASLAAVTAARISRAPLADPARWEVPVPVRLLESGTFSVSPDDSRLVFPGAGADGIVRFWVRELDAVETRPLIGSEGHVAQNTPPVFWSPDGRFIAFYHDGRIKRMNSAGGPPQVVCDVPGVAVGGSWSRDGLLVVGNTAGGLLQCPADGGSASPVTGSGDPGVVHFFPSFLPGGRTLLYLQLSRSNPSINGLYVADLDRAPDRQRPERLLETSFAAAFVPGRGGPDRILFFRDGALWTMPFDARRRVLTGSAAHVAAPVGSFRDGAFGSASADLLIYRGPDSNSQLTWLDRQGSPRGTLGEAGPHIGLALAPDATRAVLLKENPLNRADQDLWLIDVEHDRETPFTRDPFLESVPAWSADGQRLMFASGHGGSDILVKPVTGGESQALVRATARQNFFVNPLLTTMSATPDGRFLVFTAESRTGTQGDLWLASLGDDGLLIPLLEEKFDQRDGVVSPDGLWLAYVSNEAGVGQVWVRPLTDDRATGLAVPGAATLVSQRGGGTSPRWRDDGEELFYLSPEGAVMSVDVTPTALGRPSELFRAPGALRHWGVAPGGDRFLMALPVTQGPPAPFQFVLNWQAALER